ncbi:hypothetical protein CLIB1444_15S01068 [[Candida] jaroonii]|uniref:Uncharacterized protein n=1 Tax=[Candida] jaroonii TaxID=467808 RepID=A0ACA9YEG9_9ASCO|nr:hypothetical protein CLIB1444_15S01068 [[Candida] jaroonii]
MKRRADNDTTTIVHQRIPCTLTPCWIDSINFDSYEAYESHVQTVHTNICTQCKKKFPTYNYLMIHIEEHHDPFFQIKKERGDKVYKCFNYDPSESGCHKKCSDSQKRRLHMIDKHGYPRDFNFKIIDYGI